MHRVAGTVNVTFDGVEGELVVLGLDAQGISVSTGSACKVKTDTPRHTVRFSFGHHVTRRELDRIVTALCEIVHRARRFVVKLPGHDGY